MPRKRAPAAPLPQRRLTPRGVEAEEFYQIRCDGLNRPGRGHYTTRGVPPVPIFTLRNATVEQIARNALVSLLFAVLGFVLLFVGYRVFDLLTPADLDRRIFEDGNLAAAILAAAFIIALAIVIHAAIS